MKTTRNIKIFSENQPKDIPTQVTEPGYEPIQDVDINNLHSGSCDNLFLGNILEYTQDPSDFLPICLSKLRYGGTITINGRDLDVITRDYWAKRMSGNEFRGMVYSGKVSIWSLNELCEALMTAGLKVREKSMLQYDYTIVGERPSDEG